MDLRVEGRAVVLERFLSGSGRREAGRMGKREEEEEEEDREGVEREGEGEGEDLRNSSKVV